MNKLIKEIRDCRVCEEYLPYGANPIISASPKSRIIIIGQAPGRIVHETGIPWNDKSGDNLRKWMGVDKSLFYNEDIFGLMPMGFCYPGKGISGDLPPRKECAPLWHHLLLNFMKDAKLILLVGQYAQGFYLKDKVENNLTGTVKNFKKYLPAYLPLPHPSPRNNIWQVKNKWFEKKLLPELKERVNNIILPMNK